VLPPPFKPVHISLLNTSHNVEEFDCGDLARNAWLKTRAFTSHTNDDSRTYVLAENGTVLGFYAITTGSILRGALPGSMRRNAPDPVSGVLLAQLAVATSHQGQGLSRELILHAMGQVAKIAEITGCRLFFVHPSTPELTGYYIKSGFTKVETLPVPIMAMNLQMVRAICGLLFSLDRIKLLAKTVN
jgi:ribosomal protein S18 acetylase RimI-like enzyme